MKKSGFLSIRYLIIYIMGLMFSLILNACDEEEPDPPIQPMYGVPSGEYTKLVISDDSNDIIMKDVNGDVEN